MQEKDQLKLFINDIITILKQLKDIYRMYTFSNEIEK